MTSTSNIRLAAVCGKAPIYARITIDGKYTEISTGKKVNPASWDLDVKQVTGSGLEVKLANQKLVQLQTDVERIFNGLQTQFPEVTETSSWSGLKKNAGLSSTEERQRLAKWYRSCRS
ncbi:Arm DNA-binding domain-containing protein [Dyadobacter fermentans]|uniref:Arm DNA-binding domain-containing protein n=1 Tax=Dyadobacter fermentans TaxID=94254 RepID=UPI0003163AB8|nr:Arm DNA-binding domain-containing protein [Dyadobacter fermentans]